MSPNARARYYAALFTHLGAKWRMCVPVDGTVDKHSDRMWLTGVQIAKPDDADAWSIVAGESER